MKIQSLAIIFILIILPISFVLSIYTQNQIKTLNYQISYDSKLYTATYDAIKAFQLNTLNNSQSDLTNSKIRDIEASVNTFFNSVSSNFNLSGYSKEAIQEYVPAVVYTMYDGYYIYAPYENIVKNVIPQTDDSQGIVEYDINSSKTQYGLKPYVYYTKRYIGRDYDLIIKYSLDNYISIRGFIGTEYISKSGYVIDYKNINISGNTSTYTSKTDISGWNVTYRGNNIENEELYENVGGASYKYAKINGIKYYKESDDKYFYILNGNKIYNVSDEFKAIVEKNCSAKRYYIEAYIFSDWMYNNIFDKIKDDNNKLVFKDIDKEGTNNTIIEETSNFNAERFEVIKSSIETNLSSAIAGYNNYFKESANFQMPKLKETEWELISNNICAITFLQGLSIGSKVYNGYCVIPNNKTKEYVAEDSIYITSDNDEYYFKVFDNELLGNNSNNKKGYLNLDFEKASINDGDIVKYYIPKNQLGSYTSIVGNSGISTNWEGNIYKYLNDPNADGSQSDEEKKLAQIYYTALGRERYSMYRVE